MEMQMQTSSPSKVDDILKKITGIQKLLKQKNNDMGEFHFVENSKKELAKNNFLFGSYFRTLYQLLKFIKQNAPENTEKTYSNIVRALLTDKIMILLAINCYCENEQDTYWQYKQLIEHYTFFEHAPFNDLKTLDDSYLQELKPLLSELRSFYDEKAFISI